MVRMDYLHVAPLPPAGRDVALQRVSAIIQPISESAASHQFASTETVQTSCLAVSCLFLDISVLHQM